MNIHPYPPSNETRFRGQILEIKRKYYIWKLHSLHRIKLLLFSFICNILLIKETIRYN